MGGNTYDIQLRAAIVNRHIPSLADVLAISEELVHKIGERETTLLKDASLTILGKNHVGRVESGGGPNGDAFFASGDLVALSDTYARGRGPLREIKRKGIPYRRRDGPGVERRT